MNSKVAEILLQTIEFLALAPDSEIDPDAAVRQLEIVSSLLKELPKAELDGFFEYAGRKLERLRRDGATDEQLIFLEKIRENLGC
jgi:hypothetical protein